MSRLSTASSIYLSQRGDQSGQRIIGEELERDSERRWHKTRIDERRQIDEPDAVLVTADQTVGDGSLANSARSNDGKKTLPWELGRNMRDNVDAADEPCVPGRQIVRRLLSRRLRRR